MGHHVGYRMIDVLCPRDKGGRYRETRMVNMLLYIKTTLWKVSECNMYIINMNIINSLNICNNDNNNNNNNGYLQYIIHYNTLIKHTY